MFLRVDSVFLSDFAYNGGVFEVYLTFLTILLMKSVNFGIFEGLYI
jgi:hypothetical protein